MGDRLRTGRARTLTVADRAAFVRAQTRLAPVAFVPEVRLHQADEATALWHLTEAELGLGDLQPPFWAFAWAGGQGLARFILDHPGIVAGKRVLDFASGSGLVAIAAAKAGAALVEAVDIDPFAHAAIQENMAANAVAVTAQCADLIGTRPAVDIVLAGDVFYDRSFAAAATPWFGALAAAGVTVLAGDPGRHYRPRRGVREIAAYDVPVHPALEDAALKRVAVLSVDADVGVEPG
ncbi:50S ribosomal protein L11 methyltransferase [Kaistia dalseonensis]|uniref:Nicotinamide N-methyase n=1 Tax=Kaistia dalseonensis TaxID=410840 RepID=A0ABU0H4Q1_9HYPH|nr:50S ribosomal protein L11 methyltransferase [Kaistia dalseonensis]MCX5494708.1 50S ribosomal protein L11 methyltransferase [Kaistia dalseonensis]MDQ0437289.1 putative nicotinamide N-methyase [Kaistia dalseonensis]